MELSLLSMDMVDNVLDICPNFLSVALQAVFVCLQCCELTVTNPLME